MSYWNMSSSPMPMWRVNRTGISRSASATRNRRKANELAKRVSAELLAHLSLEPGDPALEIWREIAVVLLPQLGPLPVMAGDVPAAVGRAARAIELVVVRAVAHGVVQAKLLAHRDVPHGDQPDLPGHADVGVAAMVEAIRVIDRGHDVKVIFDLQHLLGEVRAGWIQLAGRQQPAATQDDQLILGDRLAAEHAALALGGMRAAFDLGG